MAGESPDKTEQQKSSGTAAEEPDPRFAVFRDPGADGGAEADAGVGGASGVTSDTATAVFRPRLPEGAAVSEPAAKPEPQAAVTASGEAAEPPEGPEVPKGREAAGSEPESGSKGGSKGGSEAEAEPGDVRLRAAVAAWVDAAAEDEPAEDADADAGTGTGAEGGKKPEAKPAAEAEPKDAPKRKAEDESTGDAAPGTGSDLRGIDQPTAVFKAVKAAKAPDRVDQATTALKLPPSESKAGDKPADSKPADGKPADDEPAGDKPADGKPESAAERTSTFVPLRSDDVRSAPAPRKPEPEPSGTSEATGTSEASTMSGASGTSGASVTSGASASAPGAGPSTSGASAAPSWVTAERTRQQPLPPKPPLDLLAELTNTPPPPETSVRNAVRRVKIWTPLVLLLLIVFAIVQVMRPMPEPELKLTAKPTYTFEGGATELSWPGQGQSAVMVDGVGSLGSEGAQKSAPIASVAKVMTAYVILKEHPLKGDEEGETITVDQQAEDESKRPDESTAPLTKGQQLTQRQLLQLLMIPSGNNAARLLARWDAGSEDAFIDKMNDAAKELGMTGSTYTDPSGLEKTTVSTAGDQLKLAQAVMRNDVFREVVDMPQVEIEGIDGKIYNNNTLLLEPGVSGIKTGSSTPAGGNLLWSANTVVDGKTLWIYGAVMGQQAGTGRLYDSLTLSLTNSLKLIKSAQEAPTSATVVKKGDVVGYVDNGYGGQAPVVATKNLKAVGWSGLKVELKVTGNGKGIDHGAKAGSEVGMVTVGTGTGKVTAPVALRSDLPEPAFGDKLTRIG
ncbi:serine hydrolase [Streptomyces sp. C11-1]|uniref:Serine hydrolase n=1 Tax=Streptomyces durocortorensis TaxID=2811104 RepID=A0ABY9VUJ1_9ACTN|nr:serine hydrolase [Streptomyces durocortorensis]WNF27611.1 serine hydrolase [Streptomyces durocortorensis]